jgi:hypothetical protein
MKVHRFNRVGRDPRKQHGCAQFPLNQNDMEKANSGCLVSEIDNYIMGDILIKIRFMGVNCSPRFHCVTMTILGFVSPVIDNIIERTRID